jgi:hypothetical protein
MSLTSWLRAGSLLLRVTRERRIGIVSLAPRNLESLLLLFYPLRSLENFPLMLRRSGPENGQVSMERFDSCLACTKVFSGAKER